MMVNKVLTYLPHGEIPDTRGFAPALVAQNLAKHLHGFHNLHVCAAEKLQRGPDRHTEWGDIYRIKQSRVYRRLFCKLTNLNPYPLHKRLAEIANTCQPDIIHIHQLEFPVAEFRTLLNRPAKIIIHGHTIRAFNRSFGEADLYLAASQHIADGLFSEGYRPDRIQVLPNGVDMTMFAPLASSDKNNLRAKLGIACDAPVLLFFGRKQEVKGFDLFLKTVDVLHTQNPHMVAIAIGPTPANTCDDSEYAQTVELQSKLVGKGVLRDYGPMPHDEIARYLQVSDVAILPSRDEPQGMAMIEAMAAGLVVVSGNVGGIRESINNGSNGILVETVGPQNNVLPVVSRILDDVEKYKEIGTIARESVAARFDWQILGVDLSNIYNDLLRNL